MKSIKKSLVVAIIFAINIFSFNLLSQTNIATHAISLGLDEVLLLGATSASVNLKLTPQAAGMAVISSVTDQSARVIISSVVSGNQTRSISAQITNGAVPSGTQLKLQALEPNSNFIGTKGTPGAEIILTGASQAIITGIGTCYSGLVSGDGYVMKYTYGLPPGNEDYSLIRSTSSTVVTVTLTLSAGA